MSLASFECLCVGVIVATLGWMSLRVAPGVVLARYVTLSACAWVGEDTCIALYGHYSYSSTWHARIQHVPLLVPLIWPLVIFSARDFVSALMPRPGLQRSVTVAAFVVLDASLIEALAVRAGFWTWREGGFAGVPPIGVLGWGFFAFGVALALREERVDPRRRRKNGAPGSVPELVQVFMLSLLLVHALLLASWWGVFRWLWRSDVAWARWVVPLALALPAWAFVIRARVSGRAAGWNVMGPRVVATSVFVALLASGPREGAAPYWAHLSALAVVYLSAFGSPRATGHGA